MLICNFALKGSSRFIQNAVVGVVLLEVEQATCVKSQLSWAQLGNAWYSQRCYIKPFNWAKGLFSTVVFQPGSFNWLDLQPTNPQTQLNSGGYVAQDTLARGMQFYLEERRTFAGLDAYAAGSQWFLPSLENLLPRTGLSFGNRLPSERSDQWIQRRYDMIKKIYKAIQLTDNRLREHLHRDWMYLANNKNIAENKTNVKFLHSWQSHQRYENNKKIDQNAIAWKERN